MMSRESGLSRTKPLRRDMSAELIDEELRRRFEQNRRLNPATSPAEFLHPDSDSTYLPTLEELVRIDLEYGWKEAASGREGPLIETYLDRFPVLCLCDVVFRLLRYEYELKLARGQSSDLGETAAGFPGG
jgi:hypothetical protein